MINQHIFVNIMMILQIGAIFTYSFNKNWLMSLYWLSCLIINFAVTYIIGK
jgi:hypothetical protein